MFRFVQNPIPVLDANIKIYGPTHCYYLGGVKKGFISIEPSFVQHFMQKNHRNYRKSLVQTEKLGHFLGNGLLTSDGDYWLQQRRLIQPGFHRKRLAALVGIIDQTIEQFAKEFQQDCKDKTPIDIYPKMMELAFRIVINSLFSTNTSEEELEKVSTNITEVQEFFIRQIRMPFMDPWFKFSGQLAQAERKASETNYVLLDLIKERRESGKKVDDLLQMLLDVRYENTGKGMTDQQILEEAVVLFVAGHETTANALAWTWYLLSQHPESVARIREELNTVLGDAIPKFEDLPKLEYMMQVIQESMRIYPPAWLTDRVSIEDDEINGYHIPKNTMMVAYIHGIHHSPDLWDQPELFRPERFTKEKQKERHSFAYMPFGGGPRLCIGNNFALMEMQLVLARMIRQFDFSTLPGQEIEGQPLITLRPKHGILMQFSER